MQEQKTQERNLRFKNSLLKDLSTFINPEEFGDIYNINGLDIQAVVDNSVANSFEKAQIQGVFKATAVVYIKQGNLTPLPLINSEVVINNLRYVCRDVQIEQGVDILTLEMMEQ